MHEMAIAQSVLEIACRHAGDGRVTRIELKIGYLRQVVPAALSFSFELIAEGTRAQGAQLEMVQVPAAGACRECGVETLLHAFPFLCGGCGGYNLDIIAGDELTVESLDIEEADCGTRCNNNHGGRGCA